MILIQVQNDALMIRYEDKLRMQLNKIRKIDSAAEIIKITKEELMQIR